MAEEEYEFLEKLYKKRDALLKESEIYEAWGRGDRLRLRSTSHVWCEVVEKELASKKHEKGERKILEKELLDQYHHRGFDKEKMQELLEAVLKGDENEKKEIIKSLAEEYEKQGALIYAAEEYGEAGDWKKSAELWMKEGKKGFTGAEYLIAARALVEAGEDHKQTFSRMAEELRKEITERREKEKKKDGWTVTWEENIYNSLGNLLHHAGKYDEACKAFTHAARNDDYERLQIKRDYYASLKDWKKAAEAQEEFIKQGSHFYDFKMLAELYHNTGEAKKEAEALWNAEEFLPAAQLAYKITGDKKFFKKAGEAYRKQRSSVKSDFFKDVWDFAENKILWEKKEKGIRPVLSLLHVVYGLPKPPEVDKTLSKEEHHKKANALWNEFNKRLKKTRASELPALLSEGIHAKALSHAVYSGGLNHWRVFLELKKIFLKYPKERLVSGENLPGALKKMYVRALDSEKNALGFYPPEMAGKSFEEGNFYEEALECYKKGGLLKEAERVKNLIPKTRGERKK